MNRKQLNQMLVSLSIVIGLGLSINVNAKTLSQAGNCSLGETCSIPAEYNVDKSSGDRYVCRFTRGMDALDVFVHGGGDFHILRGYGFHRVTTDREIQITGYFYNDHMQYETGTIKITQVSGFGTVVCDRG